MERMTGKDLQTRVDNVNRRLEERGSGYRWFVQRRNGSVALDRLRAEDGATVSLITVGSARDIGDFLHGAMVAIDDCTLRVN